MSTGKYQYAKKLATGGMAEVWLAKQVGIEGFNRHVVVKRILPHLAEDQEFVQMFLNEAKIAARFNHPNIAQIFELGEENGTYFIAMEFIHGEDLGRVMRRAWSSGQWVARHIALRIVADACQGLHYAHTRTGDTGQPLRVVHRDISPQNILVSFDGAVKVVDFGIAKAADQMSNTKSGAIKGKFAYMAPEQAGGKPLDGRTDLYALGLVLYELVTGVRPLKRDSELATLQAALACEIEPPSAVAEVPPEIDEVVMRALAKSPDDRYRDAREFQKAIEQYLVDHKELATSMQVSELMEMLFADRLNEEKRLGAPAPSTESSTNNPVPPSYVSSPSVTQPPPKPVSRPRPAAPPPPRPSPPPSSTLDEEPFEEPQEDEPSAVAGRMSPEGTVGPSRRYAAPANTSFAKPSRDVTRAAADSEATLMPVEDEPPAPSPPQAPPPRRPSRVSEPAEPPKRRTSATGQHKARRTSTGSAMPEAPPRRSKIIPEATGVAAGAVSAPAISKLVDVQGMRTQAASRLKAFVAVVVLLGVVALLAIFREPLRVALSSSNNFAGGVPIRVSVTTNPPTQVDVRPPPGNRERQLLSLGGTPIDAQSGAFVGDTIVLTNKDRGIHWEVPLEYGNPNELRSISKTFVEVTLKVTTKPRLKSAFVFRANDDGKPPTQKLGQVGLPLSVFQGVHQLAIVSDQLADPVFFEQTIGDGQKVTERVVDVSASLDKPSPQ
jgi:serine/threonine protein kinase